VRLEPASVCYVWCLPHRQAERRGEGGSSPSSGAARLGDGRDRGGGVSI
jgi:hypothetical protein